MATQPDPLRVVFCWAGVSGYMAACWRALASRADVDLHILLARNEVESINNPFEIAPLLSGLSHEIFAAGRPDIDQWLPPTVMQRRPDVIVLCGWTFWPYTKLAQHPELSHVRFVLGMDSPWKGTIRQRVGRIRLSALMRRMSAVVTAGERSDEYAIRLGVPARRLHHGYYGFDHQPLATVLEQRNARGSWPRQFLFAGRFVPEKDLGTLIAAYKLYRGRVADAWGLTCCGTGPEGRLLEGVPGVTNAGFVQPPDLPAVLRGHGAFVIASRFEPWGVVLAEAASSGLPIVCTSACGASVDLVRSYYSGLVVPPGDAEAFARALQWIHEHEDQLPVMGSRGRALADAYTAESWATRWYHYLRAAVQEER
jgi:glycosyltransferase involved in cell wall biosynthesis